MPNADHMRLARMASSWVRRTLPMGADNNFTAPGTASSPDTDIRLKISRYLLGQLVALLGHADIPLDEMTPVQVAARQRINEVAARFGAGNCHEQAMCAYRWLTQRGVVGVKLVRVSMEPYKTDNHLFVVIGAAETGTQLLDLGDIVFCDPWLAEAVSRNPDTAQQYRLQAHGAFDKASFLLFFTGFKFGKKRSEITVALDG